MYFLIDTNARKEIGPSLIKKAIYAIKDKVKMKGINKMRIMVRQQVIEEVQDVIIEDVNRANSFLKIMFANRFYLYQGLAKFYES